MFFINLLLILITVYLSLGFLFAVPFIIKGVTRIDEGAHGSTWGFRMIILPGTIVFWPVLLKKWIQASKIARHD